MTTDCTMASEHHERGSMPGRVIAFESMLKSRPLAARRMVVSYRALGTSTACNCVGTLPVVFVVGRLVVTARPVLARVAST